MTRKPTDAIATSLTSATKKRLHKDSFDFKSYLRTGHGDWKRIVLDTETTGLHPGEGRATRF